jgi:hypothetical protein
MQQTVNTDPSAGQSASPSMLLQKNADRSLVHSPLHGFNSAGFGLVVAAIIVDIIIVVGCLVVVVIVVIVVALAEVAETLVDCDAFGRVVVDENEILLEALSPFFSS